MALDPNIALSVRPAQMPDFNALGQQRLASTQNVMAMQQQAQQLQEKNALREVYSQSVNPQTGEVDSNRLLSGLAQAGRGDLIPQVQATLAETKKSTAEADKAALELHLEKANTAIGDIARVSNPVQAVGLVKKYVAAGDLDPARGEDYIARITSDPKNWQTLQQQIMTDALSVKDQIAQHLEERKFGYQQTNDAANRDVTVRGQNLSASTARRGQDLNHAEAVAKQSLDVGRFALEQAKAAREAANGPPLTEGQANAVVYGARMTNSGRILDQLEKAGERGGGRIKGTVGSIVGLVPLGIGDKLADMTDSAFNVAPNIAGGPSRAQQRAEQAQRDFLAATLRRESGASISPSELANGAKQYFARPGDSAELIAQKQKNRAIAIAGIRNAAGPGAAQVDAVSRAGDSGGVDHRNPLLK